MIKPILSGIENSFAVSLSFFLSPILVIFLEIPPPLAVFGINTQYLPANEIYVVRAAPLFPLSSLTTCINKTCLTLITSWILYLFLVSDFFCFKSLFTLKVFCSSEMVLVMFD